MAGAPQHGARGVPGDLILRCEGKARASKDGVGMSQPTPT